MSEVVVSEGDSWGDVLRVVVVGLFVVWVVGSGVFLVTEGAPLYGLAAEGSVSTVEYVGPAVESEVSDAARSGSLFRVGDSTAADKAAFREARATESAVVVSSDSFGERWLVRVNGDLSDSPISEGKVVYLEDGVASVYVVSVESPIPGLGTGSFVPSLLFLFAVFTWLALLVLVVLACIAAVVE
jgi:hypothetical protein